jgi:two-component system sensor histidine kinase DesK
MADEEKPDRFWPGRGKGSRLGLTWGAVYLVFLAYPVIDLATTQRPAWQVAVASLALAAFVVIYLRLVSLRRLMHPLDNAGRVHPLRYPVALVVLAIGMPLAFGGNFAGLMIYASCALVVSVTPRTGFRVIVVLAAATLGVLLVRHADAGSVLSLTLLTLLCPVGMIGIGRMAALIRELATTREENARLAVSEERLRFARDLHDLLGHSLSLIAIKSELAERLIPRDPNRAEAEVRDIEAVARQALVEVREAVSGYRRSLDEELTGARAALEAAGMTVELPAPGAPLPAAVESLLGWTVREATTNILRHSHARQVRIEMHRAHDHARMVVRDDGVGPAEDCPVGPETGQHGLAGLAERMAAAGGRLRAAAGPDGGFQLAVNVPLDAPSYATAPRAAERDSQAAPAH